MALAYEEFVRRWREALADEADVRLAALLPLDVDEKSLGGIWVNPLTLRHCAYLELMGNPFVGGGQPDSADAAQFLWVVSKDFVLKDTAARDRFVRGPAAKALSDAPKLAREIEDYIEEAWQDSPGTRGEMPNAPPTVSWIAVLVDLFAMEYGWTDEHILDLPVTRVWQYYRCIRQRKEQGYRPINRSDVVRRQCMVEMYGTHIG